MATPSVSKPYAPTFEALTHILGLVEDALQSSVFPDYVMKRKGVGLPV